MLRIYIKTGVVHVEMTIAEAVKLYDQFEDQLSDTSKHPIQQLYDGIRTIAESAEDVVEVKTRGKRIVKYGRLGNPQ